MSESLDGSAAAIDQCTNPYSAETHPAAHRAYREGWEARYDGRPHTANPHGTEGTTACRAWLSGWQAAHLRLAQRPSSSGSG
jgi:ribosome modulation factor